MVLLAFAAAGKKFSYFSLQLKSIRHIDSMVKKSLDPVICDCGLGTDAEKHAHCNDFCKNTVGAPGLCILTSNNCSCGPNPPTAE